MSSIKKTLGLTATALAICLLPGTAALASSHREAPNTTKLLHHDHRQFPAIPVSRWRPELLHHGPERGLRNPHRQCR